MTTARLSRLGLGLSLGVIWGVYVLVMGLLAHHFLIGTAFVTAMGALYTGYEPTVMGSIIGGLIGFVDAFIFGVLIAWFYNIFSGIHHKVK